MYSAWRADRKSCEGTFEGDIVDVHTYLTGNGRCADHAPAFALIDELYSGVLVAEENDLYVDVDYTVDGLGGNWG